MPSPDGRRRRGVQAEFPARVREVRERCRVEAAWRGERGCRYVKAGVLLDDLCRPEDAPPAPFGAPAPLRSDALMAAWTG